MMVALAEMLTARTRFLVAGREDQGVFKTFADITVPGGFEGLFNDITEEQFRENISSTQIRAMHNDRFG